MILLKKQIRSSIKLVSNKKAFNLIEGFFYFNLVFLTVYNYKGHTHHNQ